MVLTVIVTVTILALVVSGYWLNSNFEVERQGMLQVASSPTDASVSVDGASSWLQRTNTSKVLPSGEHTITLTKDGYDSWSKTINIKEGLLYKLNYPRLFLQNRYKETVYDASGSLFSIVSPNHNLLLLTNNTTNWSLIELNNEKIEPKTLDISKAFNITLKKDQTAGLFEDTILSAKWDKSSSHVLLKTQTKDGEINWVLIDVRNPSNSLNLTREFATDFTDITIFNDSASELLAIRNNNLHKINVSGRQISAVIVPDIQTFDHFGSEIIFVAKNNDTEVESEYYVGITESNSSKISTVSTAQSTTKIFLSEFYDEKYITIIDADKLTLYKKEGFSEVFSETLSFVPEEIKIGHDGEFVFMSKGETIATLDMEAMLVRTWNTSSTNYAWLDDNMIYSVANGELSVYDFDGLNHRQIATNVSGHFPATITENKWLYYFSDDSLVREWLIAK